MRSATRRKLSVFPKSWNGVTDPGGMKYPWFSTIPVIWRNVLSALALENILRETCPYRYRDLAEHGNALLDISQRHVLGCRHDDGTYSDIRKDNGQARRLKLPTVHVDQLAKSQWDIAGSRGHINYQCIKF